MGNMPTVMRWCAELEEALKPFDARPHWGKLFAMDKHELFASIVADGATPRKTFSLGEAEEKRYYLECRQLAP